MEIQQLNEANSHLLQNVADDVFDYPIVPSSLDAFLSCPRHCMLLAVEGESVVGMISAVENFHPDKPPEMWINELSVTPERQRQGIGHELIAALLDIARKRSCVAAWVGTEESNLAANRCYQSVGDAELPQRFVLHEWKLSS